MGYLIGAAIAGAEAKVSGQRRALEGMRDDLQSVLDAALFDHAFALANADVMAAVLAELQDGGQRTLSLATARAERNRLYVRRAAAHVRSLSGGALQLRREPGPKYCGRPPPALRRGNEMSVIGPGVGTLIGLQYGEMRNAKTFARSRASLDLAISDAQDEALLAKATKDAAKAVVNALLDELFADDAGRLKARRFSDIDDRGLHARQGDADRRFASVGTNKEVDIGGATINRVCA